MAVEEWQRHPEMQKASTNSKAATIHPAEKEQRASTGLLYTCYGEHRGNNWKFPVYCAFKEFPFCLIIGKQSGVLSVRRIEKLIASEVRTVENVNGFKEGVDQVKWAAVSVIKYGSEVVLAQKAHTYLTAADQVRDLQLFFTFWSCCCSYHEQKWGMKDLLHLTRGQRDCA